MPKYRKLPPISRSPTPPLDTLRRLRSSGDVPGELIEEDGQGHGDEEISGTPSAPIAGEIPSASSLKKRRKARKRSLVLGKDTSGSRKRRKLQTEGKEIQKALDSDTPLDSGSEDDSDMLESITVAGGFLIFGQGYLNGAKTKELDETLENGGDQKDGNGEMSIDVEGKLGGKVAGAGSVESITRATPEPAPKTVEPQGSKPPSLIKGRPQHLGPAGPPEALNVDCPHASGAPGGHGEESSVSCDNFRPPTPTPDAIGRSESPPIELGNSPEGSGDRSFGKLDLLEDHAIADHVRVEVGGVPLSPAAPGVTAGDASVGAKDREPPHPVGGVSLVGGVQEDEEVKSLVFDISASPGNASPQKITGLDFYCTAKRSLSWDRLYGIFRQKFSADLDLSNLQVLVDREFQLKKQEDLDECIRDLRQRGVPKHDIQLLCSPDEKCGLQDMMTEDIRGLGGQGPESLKRDDGAEAAGDVAAAGKARSPVIASGSPHVLLPPQTTNPDGAGEELQPAPPGYCKSPGSLEQRDTASELGTSAVPTPSTKARTPEPTLPPTPQTDLEHQPGGNLKHKTKPKTNHLNATEAPREPESSPQILLSDERSGPKPVYRSTLKQAIDRIIPIAVSLNIPPPANRWRNGAGDVTILTPGAGHGMSPMPGGIGDKERSRLEQGVRKIADTTPSQLPKDQSPWPMDPALPKTLPSVSTGFPPNTAQEASVASTSNMRELPKNQCPNAASSVTTTTLIGSITALNSGPTAVVNADNTTKIADGSIKPVKGEGQENGFHTSPLDIGDAMDADPMPPAAETPSGLDPAGADVNEKIPQSADKGKCRLTVKQPGESLRTGGFPTVTRPPASGARPIGQRDLSGPAERTPSHVHPMDIDSEAHIAGLVPKAAITVDKDSTAPMSIGERGIQGNQHNQTSTAGTAPLKRNRVRKGKETKVQPGLKNYFGSGERLEVLEKQQLMVKLKIPPHVGPKQGSFPKTIVPNRAAPVPQTPIWPVPTPPSRLTINDLLKKTPQIPRPQPYRNPNTASGPAATQKQITAPPPPPPPPPPPSMGAPPAARIRAEQTKVPPRSTGSIGTNNIPAPLFPQNSAGMEAPIPLPTAHREIPPRPAYWKPGPKPGASITNFATPMDTIGLDPPARETPEGALNIATVPPSVAPTSVAPTTLSSTLGSIPPLDPNKVAAMSQVATSNGSNRPNPIITVPEFGIEGPGSSPSRPKETIPLASNNPIPPLGRKKVTATPVAKGGGSNRPCPIVMAPKAASVPEPRAEGPGDCPSHPGKITQVSKSTIPPLDSKKITAAHQVAAGSGRNRPSPITAASKTALVPESRTEEQGNSLSHLGKIALLVSKSTVLPLDLKKVTTTSVATGNGGNRSSPVTAVPKAALVPESGIEGPGNSPSYPEKIAPLASKSTVPPLDSKKVTATHQVATGNGSNHPSSIVPASKAATMPDPRIEGPGNSLSHPEKIAPLVSKGTVSPLDSKKETTAHQVAAGNGCNPPSPITAATKTATVSEFGVVGLGNSLSPLEKAALLVSKSTIPPLGSEEVTAANQVAIGSGSNRPSSIISAPKPASVLEFGIEGPGSPPPHPKKIAPLVSKNNFLYYEPVVGGKDKVGRNGIERASSGGATVGPGPLWTTEERVPKTTYMSPPPLQSPVPAPKQQIRAQDMVLNFIVYEDPTRKTVVYGHEILLNSAEPRLFSWDKLVNILGARIGFVDFKECLVFNYHYMVENEAELNEGIVEGYYRTNNGVVIAKVDPLGRLPPGLVARMKETRKALRNASLQ